MQHIIQQLQNQLQQHANPKTKAWFDNYLKGAISYYGVKTPQVKTLVKQWYLKNHLQSLPIAEQVSLCQQLMQLPYAEEKFAAIIYMQQYLLQQMSSQQLLDLCEWVFKNNCIDDWSTADWFTIRVIANILTNDMQSLPTIQQWSQSKSLWQRRASIVAMRVLVKNEAYIEVIAQTIDVLVDDSQRFIQTGIGWTLSDLSKYFPKRAAAIVEQYFDLLSQEVINRHTKYLPNHSEYKKRKRKNSF